MKPEGVPGKNLQEGETPMIQSGIYRHYKGKDYQVIGVATHSETEEKLVIYRALYGSFGLWARPVAKFGETIEFEGKRVARFERIKEASKES